MTALAPLNESGMPTSIPRNVVLRFAALGEGVLVILALCWIEIRNLTPSWHCSWETVGSAILFAAPLIVINGYLFLGRAGPRFRHPAWRVFTERYIRPLCAELTPLPAFTVALLAGLGEELAFRGVLLTELRPLLGDWGAVLVSGVIFGWVHFLGLWREFFPVLMLYCLFGIALGAIYLVTMSLPLLILIHTLYDFVVICLIYRTRHRDS